MTLDEAKKLQYRQVVIDTSTGKRWRVNGKVKVWKKDSSRILIPVKHGLFTYGYIDEYNVGRFNYA